MCILKCASWILLEIISLSVMMLLYTFCVWCITNNVTYILCTKFPDKMYFFSLLCVILYYFLISDDITIYYFTFCVCCIRNIVTLYFMHKIFWQNVFLSFIVCYSTIFLNIYYFTFCVLYKKQNVHHILCTKFAGKIYFCSLCLVYCVPLACLHFVSCNY